MNRYQEYETMGQGLVAALARLGETAVHEGEPGYYPNRIRFPGDDLSCKIGVWHAADGSAEGCAVEVSPRIVSDWTRAVQEGWEREAKALLRCVKGARVRHAAAAKHLALRAQVRDLNEKLGLHECSTLRLEADDTKMRLVLCATPASEEQARCMLEAARACGLVRRE